MTDDQFRRHNAGERIFEDDAASEAVLEPATKKRKLQSTSVGGAQAVPSIHDQRTTFWDPKVAPRSVIHGANGDLFLGLIKDWIKPKKGDYSLPTCGYIARLVCSIQVMKDCWAEPAWSKIQSVVANELSAISEPEYTPKGKTTHSKLKESMRKTYSRYWICL